MMHVYNLATFLLHRLWTRVAILIALLCLSACQTATPKSLSSKNEVTLEASEEAAEQSIGTSHHDAADHAYQDYRHQWHILPFQEWLLPDNSDTPNTLFIAMHEQAQINAKHDQVEQWLRQTDSNTPNGQATRSRLLWMREHLSRQQQWLAQHPNLMTHESAWFVSVSKRLLHTPISSVPEAHDYLDQLEQVPSLLSEWVDYLEDNPNAKVRPNLDEFNHVVNALNQWAFSSTKESTNQTYNLTNILQDFSEKLAALDLYPENTEYIQKRANTLHEKRLKPALKTLLKTLKERQIGIVKAPPISVVADEEPVVTDTSPNL